MTLPKASEIFEVDYLMSNGEYTGWYLRSLENGKDTFETKEQAESLLSKWDSVEALEAENALYREYLQEITNRVNDGEILSDKLFVKIEKALKQTTKTK